MRQGLRSFLFVPGDDDRKLAKAASAKADALIIDLEDAVAPENKVAARRRVLDYIESYAGSAQLVVRINAAGTPFFVDDIEAIAESKAAAVMLPKASDASLRELAALSPNTQVVALIETALGVEQAFSIASHRQVVRLMLGSADLAAELGITLSSNEIDMQYPRARVAFASAAALREAPIDVVHLAVSDAEALLESSRRGKALGFTAKACIHPAQIDVVNRVFSPSADEVNDALGVVEAYTDAQQSGLAVTAYNGKLVDLPVVLQAQRILSMHNAAPMQSATNRREE
ncbi:HpcH/HpaI aldolase/citrate lyase family protein [Subtercola endophyticus]|uniref:HpcH/HpaI aldolase/citrate lyase family protein n=1 Tax=Subtercola endophyticus TaxID=2895559 RepID=UPI001E4E0058|nr:CoA ester lyase [Subtercola endophyticus]UFS61187.1 CoA ester lyase [Subtercola endophyticus]